MGTFEFIPKVELCPSMFGEHFVAGECRIKKGIQKGAGAPLP